jgi:hypothetical protein
MDTTATTGETKTPTLSDLRLRYKDQEDKLAIDTEALERTRQYTGTALACIARIRTMSIEHGNLAHQIEAEAEYDAFHNLECKLEDHMERVSNPKRYVAYLDSLNQRFVEVEQPKLERAEHEAEIVVLKDELDLSDTRVVMAETKLQGDMAAIDQQNGGVFVHSNLVAALQEDRATASRAYFNALDSFKDFCKRQDARRAAIANVGMITSAQVSRAIPR